MAGGTRLNTLRNRMAPFREVILMVHSIRSSTPLFYLPFLAVAWAPSVNAERNLSADEVRQLFSDKTVVGEVVRLKRRFTAYYSADGIFKNKKTKGEWKVTEEGQHCLRYGEKKMWSCGIISAAEDGSYKKYLPATTPKEKNIHIITFHKFTAGNTGVL